MSNTLTIRLPEELARQIEQQARVTGRSRGQVVKEAVSASLGEQARPYLALAGAVEGSPDLSRRKGFSRR